MTNYNPYHFQTLFCIPEVIKPQNAIKICPQLAALSCFTDIQKDWTNHKKLLGRGNNRQQLNTLNGIYQPIITTHYETFI